MRRSISVVCGLLLFAVVVQAQEQRFANIGDLKLQNGGAIRENREQEIPLEDAINNMSVIDAVFRSATTKHWEEPL